MKLELLKERPITREHHLFAFVDRERRRPHPDDTCAVFCSCGRRLTISVASQYQAALDLAARSHKRDLDRRSHIGGSSS